MFMIYPVGINESLVVDLEMLCSCPCELPGNEVHFMPTFYFHQHIVYASPLSICFTASLGNPYLFTNIKTPVFVCVTWIMEISKITQLVYLKNGSTLNDGLLSYKFVKVQLIVCESCVCVVSFKCIILHRFSFSFGKFLNAISSQSD